jgi:hypothetical protein
MVPVTIGGTVFGLGAVALDQIANGKGSIKASKTGMDFVTSFDLGGAISLGFARVYGYSGKEPGDVVPSYDGTFMVNLGKHETWHTTDQWQKYGLGFIISWLFSGGPSTSNPWEQEADQHARVP